jgi:hypothetical protein
MQRGCIYIRFPARPSRFYTIYRSNSGVPRKSQSNEFNASVERLHVLLSSAG